MPRGGVVTIVGCIFFRDLLLGYLCVYKNRCVYSYMLILGHSVERCVRGPHALCWGPLLQLGLSFFSRYFSTTTAMQLAKDLFQLA